MDTETAEAIDTLRSDIRHLHFELRGVDSSLTDRIEGVESALTVRIDGVESSLTARIDDLESSLRAEMRELHADPRRHTDVLTESLRDDIRMVAEAVVTLSAKVDTLLR